MDERHIFALVAVVLLVVAGAALAIKTLLKAPPSDNEMVPPENIPEENLSSQAAYNIVLGAQNLPAGASPSFVEGWVTENYVAIRDFQMPYGHGSLFFTLSVTAYRATSLGGAADSYSKGKDEMLSTGHYAAVPGSAVGDECYWRVLVTTPGSSLGSPSLWCDFRKQNFVLSVGGWFSTNLPSLSENLDNLRQELWGYARIMEGRV